MLHKEHPSFLTELIGESVPDMLPRRNSDTFRERHIEILREVSEPGHMYEPKRCVIERTGSIWVDALGSLHEASRSFARTKRGRALVFGLQLMSHGGSLVEMPKNLEDGLSEMVDWIDETYIEPVVEAIDEARVQLETIERTVETVDDRHERMNEAYDDAADQLRGMEHLKDQWGEQTIESMAQTIERFDVQSMWEYLAENGQLSVEQVSVNSDIRGVFVYDDLTL
ncbi:hypothetical protein KKH24_02195, partial [Patescibacteria group bacterium]|nr:hypothetical protein [Patescibacteria group bacterium]